MAAKRESGQSLRLLLEEARQLLGLPEQASFQELQRAYRAQSRRVHPDHQTSPDKAAATLRMQKINDAYRILKDYFFQYRISLRHEDIQDGFDVGAWWQKRFGGSYWQEDDDHS
jgi:DnaJ-domain-containing protein 1